MNDVDQIRLFSDEEEEDALLDKMQNLIEDGTVWHDTMAGSSLSYQGVTLSASAVTVTAPTTSAGSVSSSQASWTNIGVSSSISMERVHLKPTLGGYDNPIEGTLIMDGNDNSLKYFNGVRWITLANGQQGSLDL